jgi:hypothetical protein
MTRENKFVFNVVLATLHKLDRQISHHRQE